METQTSNHAHNQKGPVLRRIIFAPLQGVHSFAAKAYNVNRRHLATALPANKELEPTKFRKSVKVQISSSKNDVSDVICTLFCVRTLQSKSLVRNV